MVDTVRTDAEILALLTSIVDDSAELDRITQQTMRDMYVTLLDRIANVGIVNNVFDGADEVVDGTDNVVD